MGLARNEYTSSGGEDIIIQSKDGSSQKVGAKSQPRNYKALNSSDMYRTQDVPNIARVGQDDDENA